ncbi:hypothetical protein FE391_19570 [Nonomuraea sp. KC401]|uniref:DUF6285 domain-containing protein n=1 Tax=unclassified Nonomuraea TaxID=2593643 RepID=UPI0010FCF7F5|nr:DUF6285 domain-containing protein [Nonomuraea sp. KC401]NBE97668.1 hypothetical protein [Nonomuraea sp. K271]TLF71401.1 hypothetical protein FE391_19570 [Nonomuraea sp. KC401]
MTPSSPHDVPTAAQLVAAVRDFLQTDVLPAVDGRTRYHARVAINVLAMVQREIELGSGQAGEHAARLAALGMGGDAALAAAIREGRVEDGEELISALERAVLAKLAVAHPDYPSAG